MLQWVAVGCSGLQGDCSELQCVAMCCSEKLEKSTLQVKICHDMTYVAVKDHDVRYVAVKNICSPQEQTWWHARKTVT